MIIWLQISSTYGGAKWRGGGLEGGRGRDEKCINIFLSLSKMILYNNCDTIFFYSRCSMHRRRLRKWRRRCGELLWRRNRLLKWWWWSTHWASEIWRRTWCGRNMFSCACTEIYSNNKTWWNTTKDSPPIIPGPGGRKFGLTQLRLPLSSWT